MQANRFVTLDSWRGVAALAVVAFHFRTTAGLGGVAIFNGMYLFVDFFFVLSGFVICSSYGVKLRNGYGIRRFMWLRFGRVYPLHVAVLVGFIALQALVVYPRTGNWFPAPRESWDTIFSNIFLIQSLHFYDFLTWNEPSWSISVEFFTYLLFALAVTRAGGMFWPFCVTAICAAPAFLFLFNGGKNLDSTATYGLIRCIYGFGSGAVAYELYVRFNLKALLKANRLRGSISEAVIVIVIAAFIGTAGTGPASLLAPLLFGVSVIVFAAEAGTLSRLMRFRPLVLLGTISYSIYMVHMLVISWWLELFRAALFKIGGQKLFEGVDDFARAYVFLAEKNYTGLGLMLLLVLIVSSITYIFIEKPCRELSRRSLFSKTTTSESAIAKATSIP
jgi:peptidoglycan/LPS O-acetylase OafA/YrhL